MAFLTIINITDEKEGKKGISQPRPTMFMYCVRDSVFFWGWGGGSQRLTERNSNL